LDCLDAGVTRLEARIQALALRISAG
jgi:hypothetical protein